MIFGFNTQLIARVFSATRNSLACLLALACIAFAQKGDVRQANRLAVVEAERAFARAAATKGTRDAFLEFLGGDGIIFQPGPVNGKQFWQARASRKGLLSWEPILADDARLFRENSFPAVGKQAALALLSTKKGILRWQPTMADISHSGDLGYTYGTYDLKGASADQKPEHGNYVRVWKRQMNGRWKVVIDILNPMPSSET